MRLRHCISTRLYISYIFRTCRLYIREIIAEMFEARNFAQMILPMLPHIIAYSFAFSMPY